MKIALLGYMGSGKSAMGRAISVALDMEHVDLDVYIEKRKSMTIPQIFSSYGESGFRSIETASLQELMEKDCDMIISLGGGTPCFNDNMKYLQGKCHSVYLQASPETLARRLSRSRNPRPLIQGKNPEELLRYVRESLELREPFYTQADYKVNVDTLSIDDSSTALLSLIKEKILTTHNNQ